MNAHKVESIDQHADPDTWGATYSVKCVCGWRSRWMPMRGIATRAYSEHAAHGGES